MLLRACFQILTCLLITALPPAAHANICNTAFTQVIAKTGFDGVAMLRQLGQEQEFLIAEVARVMALIKANQTPGTKEATAPFLAMADGVLVTIKDSGAQCKSLLNRLSESVPELQAEAAAKSKILDTHLAGLPETFSGTSLTKLVPKVNAELESWAKLNEELKFADTIKLIRKHAPELLQEPSLQMAIQRFFANGIALTIRQSVLMSLELRAPLQPYIYLAENAKTYQWGNVQSFDAERSKVYSDIITNEPLFSELMRELVLNARSATQRRFQASGREYRSFVDNPRTRLRRVSKGLKILIEDQGDPSEFSRMTGIAQSSDLSRSGGLGGLGVGRYRSVLIAGYLGMKLTHRATANGSGSIVEVFIPNTLIQE
jgi:hypothetical protein